MKHRLHIWVTILTIGPLAAWSLSAFLGTVDPQNISDTLLTLSLTQVHYLLVLVTCTILLYELSDTGIARRIAEEVLIPLEQSRTRGFRLTTITWWIAASALSVLGFLIPLLDLLGLYPFSVSIDVSQWAPKLALLLLSTMYIYHAIDRPINRRVQLQLVANKTGIMQVFNREQDHAFMLGELDNIAHGSTIYVTHFEEPRNAMHTDGYYYEGDFMNKWYTTIKDKEIRVQQVILINSWQDLEALDQRLELIRDIPHFSLGCILAPRLTMFLDYMIMPGRFALLGFSDNPAMRNMNEFAVVITAGPAIRRFEHHFTDILWSEAIHVKTFEGVDVAAVARIKAQASDISKISSRVIREWFPFTQPDRPRKAGGSS